MTLRVAIDSIPSHCLEAVKQAGREVRDPAGRVFVIIAPDALQRIIATGGWEPKRCQGCGD